MLKINKSHQLKSQDPTKLRGPHQSRFSFEHAIARVLAGYLMAAQHDFSRNGFEDFRE